MQNEMKRMETEQKTERMERRYNKAKTLATTAATPRQHSAPVETYPKPCSQCSWCIVIILCNVCVYVYISSMKTITVPARAPSSPTLVSVSWRIVKYKQHHIFLHIRKFLVYINCNKNKLNFFSLVLYKIIISIKSIRSGDRTGKRKKA